MDCRTSKRVFLLAAIGLCSLACPLHAQKLQPHFSHLSLENGFSNLTVFDVVQGYFGYIWFATEYGLCRYNGHNMEVYTHNPNDSTSISDNAVSTLFVDKAGTMWVGGSNIINRFDYKNKKFTRFALPQERIIRRITEDEEGHLLIASSKGLFVFDKITGKVTLAGQFIPAIMGDSLNGLKRTSDFVWDKEGRLWLAIINEIVCVDWRFKKVINRWQIDPAYPGPQHDGNINGLAFDHDGNLWFGIGFVANQLVRLSPSTGQIKRFSAEEMHIQEATDNRFVRSLCDRKGRIWFAGLHAGLCMYDPKANKFQQFLYDPLVESGPSSNSIRCLYEDRDGSIWVGTNGYGVGHFQPEHDNFTVIQPRLNEQPTLPDNWCRAAIEDKSHQLWLGTFGGLARIDQQTGKMLVYSNRKDDKNQIIFNSIRSLACDSSDCVWIGTSNGLNRYEPLQNKMRPIAMQDSSAGKLIWSLIVTRAGEVFAGLTHGLHLWNPVTGVMDNFSNDPVFKPYADRSTQAIFESLDGSIWLGFNGSGLLRWDRKNKTVKTYLHDPANPHSLPDDHVYCIKEDHNGELWIATQSGIARLTNPGSGEFQIWNTDGGLPGNRCGAIQVDPQNRIWFGTNRGLCCLDSDRKSIHTFSSGDGLPTQEFNNQEATSLQDGRLCYPSLRGFVLFNPNEILNEEAKGSPVTYLTGFKVFYKKFDLQDIPEIVQHIDLGHDQNFFTFELASLFFESPEKCQFRYKLDNFDKDWITTREPIANYTNVPGGDYVFHFKSTIDPNNWNTPEKIITVHINTIFYKTGWFFLLLGCFGAAVVYWFYRFRVKQALQISHLQTQAAHLEKDKAMVQYQNLVNQFNPHFLFNSLASLDGLIFTDQKLASKFLGQLSKIYRYLLENKTNELVTLRQEVNFVEHYIALLKTRFGAGIEFSMQLPEADLSRLIIPVTIQILIENAVKHNLTSIENPLIIAIVADGRYLTVRNNLVSRPMVANSNKKGLDNLSSLYRFISPLPVEINNDGQFFTIRIPLI
jgi:ligand-binding sensor domain-containing protein/cell division protein FtsB